MRALVIIFVMLCLAGPAAAQRAGSYSMSGVTPTGEPYQGSAILRQTGRETWEVTFRGAAGEPLVATGISANGILSLGFELGGETGAAWYRVMQNGTLVGRWTTGTNGQVGTETLVPK